jgi:hypothetical protein
LVDGLYDDRHKLFTDDHTYDGHKYTFSIKHLDQAKDNPFFIRGLWAEPHSINNGIIQSKGELLMSCNDTCTLTSKNMLTMAWKYYKLQGLFLLPCCVIRVPEVRSGRRCIHDKDEDHRLKKAREIGRAAIFAPGGWFHGFSFFSAESALRVNGYNTALSGLYGSIDCDMGMRLETAGYKFYFDSTLLYHRYSVFNDLPKKERTCTDVPLSNTSWKPNGGIMWYNKNRKIFRVNDVLWTPEMMADAWKDLRQVFIDNKCLNIMTEKPPVRGTPGWELLQWWYKNQTVYDVGLLRDKVIANY